MTHSKQIVGVDLGDVHSQVCILDAGTGRVLEERKLRTSKAAFEAFFAKRTSLRVALETGTHSPWTSRVLEDCGHEVVVANARKVRLVHAGRRKSDRLDAEKLARLMRYDERLLAPIQHRGKQAQADLSVLRSRASLVRGRTQQINTVRGLVKSFGSRLPTGASTAFHGAARKHLPDELLPALLPNLLVIEELNRQIMALHLRVKELVRTAYPEANLLMQVHGVAEITSLTFILTLEDPSRFKKSRTVGAYLGLTPGQRQSGARDLNMRISKEGDEELRRLLVQCAHRILARNSPDSDLKRHGESIIKQGGATAKRRAVIAVTRKLAVLLHRLWATGEVYEPLRNSRRAAKRTTRLTAKQRQHSSLGR